MSFKDWHCACGKGHFRRQDRDSEVNSLSQVLDEKDKLLREPNGPGEITGLEV